MIEITLVKVKCPYCGFEQKMEADNWRWQGIRCEASDGGCDKLFVAKTIIIVEAVVKKVEGEA